MPTGFAARSCRHAIVLIATWLVVLQAFLAGVATARAAAMPAPAGAIGAICHGAGSAAPAPADGTAPENAEIRHLCCAYCTSAAPAIAPLAPPRLAEVRQASRAVIFSSFTLVISLGAIRAGPSRAPPSLA